MKNHSELKYNEAQHMPSALNKTFWEYSCISPLWPHLYAHVQINYTLWLNYYWFGHFVSCLYLPKVLSWYTFLRIINPNINMEHQLFTIQSILNAQTYQFMLITLLRKSLEKLRFFFFKKSLVLTKVTFIWVKIQ